MKLMLHLVTFSREKYLFSQWLAYVNAAAVLCIVMIDIRRLTVSYTHLRLTATPTDYPTWIQTLKPSMIDSTDLFISLFLSFFFFLN